MVGDGDVQEPATAAERFSLFSANRERAHRTIASEVDVAMLSNLVPWDSPDDDVSVVVPIEIGVVGHHISAVGCGRVGHGLLLSSFAKNLPQKSRLVNPQFFILDKKPSFCYTPALT